MTRIRTRLAGAALGGLLIVAGAPAWAQDSAGDGWFRPGGYAGARGLVTSLADSNLEDPAFPTVDVEVSADIGFGLGAFAGYRFGNGFRGEVELTYRVNDLDEISINDPTGAVLGFPVSGSAPVDGDVSSLATMATVYYDFRTGSALIPYLGAGVGLARVAVDSSDLDVDESDTVFAYQARAGLGLALSPTVTLFGGYAFFATADPTIEGTDIEYTTHNAEFGLRLAF